MGASAVAMLIASSAAAQQAPAASFQATVQQANQAHIAYDIRAEYQLWTRAVGLAESARDHAAVERRLALLEWRYLDRVTEARVRLRRLTEGSAAAEAWLGLARMEQALGRYPAAQQAADRALAESNTPGARSDAQIAFLRAVVGAGVQARDARRPVATAALEFARDELDALVQNEPGQLESSRLLLRAALLTDSGDAARRAWRSYHHVFPGRPIPGLLAAAGSQLDQLLDRLEADNLDAGYRADLALALAGTRFIEEAALIARDPRLDTEAMANDRIDVLVVYASAIEELRGQVEEYYRQQTLGDYDPDALEPVVRAAAMRVWQAADIDQARLPTNEELFAFLERRFGALITLSRTNRRYDLRMGHLVRDEVRTIEQNGRTKQVRFVALDNMLSYGFRDWAWQHRRGARGFASTGTITQIRPLYVPDALRAWRTISDADALAAYEGRIGRAGEFDERRSAADPFAYLPGLDMRLQLKGWLGLREELEAQGLQADRLRAAFLLDFQEALTESSIIAHEGRHSLDLGTRPAYHPEFAAKMAEIAYSPRPRLAFAGIIDPSIGDGSFHGTGNHLVMQAMVRWIDAHRDEIDGLDPTRPLLPQLDLLTPDQLRRAARDGDPFDATPPE